MAEQTKRPGKRSFADEAMVNDLVDGIYRFSEKRYPFLVGTIVWIFDFLTKSLAFNIRAVTRSGLGSRTFGVFLILDAFFLQKAILFILLYVKIHNDFKFEWLWQMFNSDTKPGATFYRSLIWKPNTDIIDLLFKDTTTTAFAIKNIVCAYILPNIYGYIILLAGLGKLISRVDRRMNGVKEHSYGSGTSIFFAIFNGTKTAVNDFICLVIEPLFFFLIGFGLWKLADSKLGPFLMLCALALFYEEYKPYSRRRGKIQDKIDAEFEVEKLKEGLRRYDEAEKKKKGVGSKVGRPVEFATDSDASRYRSEMKKVASGSSSVGLG